MDIKDISLDGKTLKGLGEQGNSWNTPQDFQKIGKEKIYSLKQLIKELEDLITEREKMSKQLIKEGDSMKADINKFITENKVVSPEDARDRNGLRQKQIEISTMQLNEKVTSWKDVALLKKELRERQKELTDKEDRINMFDKILEA